VERGNAVFVGPMVGAGGVGAQPLCRLARLGRATGTTILCPLPPPDGIGRGHSDRLRKAAVKKTVVSGLVIRKAPLALQL